MKIFLDTADIEEIRIAARWGVLDGVTTNPTLYGKIGGSYEDILKQICELTPGPVSAEVVAEHVDGMLEEGRAFAKLAPNIVVKVPMSEEGLEAIYRFAEEGIKTNCTLIFTANQGLLAAKAGASLLSPFVGRLDDINQDGMDVIRELVAMVENYDLDTEVLAASIRHPRHMTEAALLGAHICTTALQGAPADGPPPADRQGHQAVPRGLGQGARRSRREERRDGRSREPWPPELGDRRKRKRARRFRSHRDLLPPSEFRPSSRAGTSAPLPRRNAREGYSQRASSVMIRSFPALPDRSGRGRRLWTSSRHRSHRRVPCRPTRVSPKRH